MLLDLIRLPKRCIWKHQVLDIFDTRFIDGDSWVSAIAIFVAGKISGQTLEVFRGVKSIP
jgi:hypothetical protein